MSEHFFERPILNSPYELPQRHHDLDPDGQPTERPPLPGRRRSELITPVPKPKKKGKAAAGQEQMTFTDSKGLSDGGIEYNPTPIINEIRQYVDAWRTLPNPAQWQVTPSTQPLLQHWRTHDFAQTKPFFCQIEAVETMIWLTEVAPTLGVRGKKFLDHVAGANHQANPELLRLAMKMAVCVTSSGYAATGSP